MSSHLRVSIWGLVTQLDLHTGHLPMHASGHACNSFTHQWLGTHSSWPLKSWLRDSQGYSCDSSLPLVGVLCPMRTPRSSQSSSPHAQIFVVELWGRRFLLLIGFSTCLTACVVLTIALALQVRSTVLILHLGNPREGGVTSRKERGEILSGLFKPRMRPCWSSLSLTCVPHLSVVHGL